MGWEHGDRMAHARALRKAARKCGLPRDAWLSVKRIEAAIVKYRFTTAVRAPWLKKHLHLRCHLSTVTPVSASNG